jgi:hypothetical protein
MGRAAVDFQRFAAGSVDAATIHASCSLNSLIPGFYFASAFRRA